MQNRKPSLKFLEKTGCSLYETGNHRLNSWEDLKPSVETLKNADCSIYMTGNHLLKSLRKLAALYVRSEANCWNPWESWLLYIRDWNHALKSLRRLEAICWNPWESWLLYIRDRKPSVEILEKACCSIYELETLKRWSALCSIWKYALKPLRKLFTLCRTETIFWNCWTA